MRKGQVTFQTLAIGALVAGLTMVFLTLFIGGFDADYGAKFTKNESFTSLDRYGEINRTVNQMTDILQKDNESFVDQALGPIDEAFAGGYTSIRLIFEIVPIFSDIINNVAENLGIPSAAVAVLLLIITLILAFSIIAAITRVISR